MKRAVKILVIALVLALGATAFAITSFASDTDETVKTVLYEGFEEYEIGPFAYDTVNFIVGGRSGAYAVRTSDNGNKYATQAFAVKEDLSDTRAPYISMPMKTPQLVGGKLTKGDYPIAEHKYFAFEFDYMTPTGRHALKTNMETYFASYYINAEGKRTSKYFQSAGSTISITHGEKEGEYLLKSSTVSATFKANPGEWKHFTLIVEPDTTANEKGGVISSYNLSKTKIHLYIDGQFIFTQENALASAAGTVDRLDNYYNGTLDYAAIADFRLNFATTALSADNENDLSAYDNLKTTAFTKDYEGDHEDAIEYLYDGYEKPCVTSVAKVDDVGYGWIVEAMEAAKTGSKVELFCDAVGIHKPECAQTVITNGYKFEYEEGEWLIVEDTGDGTVVFREPTEDEQCTVRWLNPDGSVYKSEIVVVNKRAYPDAPPVVDGDGWYAIEYVWGLADGSVATDENYLITGSVDFYPIMTKAYLTLSDVKYTVRITGGFEMFLAIPKKELPAEISSLAVYKGESLLTAVSECDKHDLYAAGVADISKSTEATADLTVKMSVKLPSGEQKELSVLVALSPLDYVRAIFEDEDHIDFSASMVSTVKYFEALSSLGATVGDRMNGLTKKYSAIFVKEEKMPTTDESLGELSSLISRIGFTVGDAVPAVKICFTDAASVKDVSFAITKKAKDGTELTYVYGIDEEKSTAGADGAYTEIVSASIPVYLLDGKITVTVADTNGVKVSGSYGLVSFYNSVKSGGTTLDGATYSTSSAQSTKAAVQALYNMALAYSTYFYGEVTVPTKAQEFIVTYDDYDAVGDGVTDDFAAIKAAHDFANSLVADGYVNVTVKAGRNATYYIGAENGTAKGERIVINTNTDFNGATFIIDDSAVADGSKHIFEIASTVPVKTYTSGSSGTPGEAITAINQSGVKAGTETKLDLGIGHPALLKVTFGIANERYTLDIIVDGAGNISSKTPIDRDYGFIYSITAYNIDESPITVEDAVFLVTPAAYGEEKGVFKRGIYVSRYGVTVLDITRELEELPEDADAVEYAELIEVVAGLKTVIE